MIDRHAMNVSHNLMVRMRDGVRLATDLYRPMREDGSAHPGPLPTILTRTSYNKSAEPMVIEPIARFFTRHGYAVVLQDLRGRGKSEGTGQYFHIANIHEGEDGYDTIEWIAAQSWSNGRVGMVGSSHLGIVQNVAALHRPPHLTAIWADVAPTKAIDGCNHEGGAMALHMFGAMFLHGYDAQEIADNPAARAWMERDAEELRGLLAQMPFRPGTMAITTIPAIEQTLFRYYRNGTLDEWWNMETMHQRDKWHRFADIPATVSSGWYDPFATDAAEQFLSLSRQNRSPTRLILGPWNHGGVRSGGSGRRTTRGLLDHGGAWRSGSAWPPPETREETWHLHEDGLLSPAAPRDAKVSWEHDPDHPVPSIGAAVTGFSEWLKLPEGINPAWTQPRARMRSIIPDGPMHQRERADLVGCRAPYRLLAARSDVLVFQTPPLERAVEIIGAITVRLSISSSAVDTDITVKFLDVHPPGADWPEGFHMNLVDTIRRGRFRNGYTREEFMQPGQAHDFVITLPPVANRFNAGHRIRLDIASSNFPRFDVNPGTGEPLGRHTHSVKALNTLHLGASSVTLPIVNAK
jgi:predicted acyl esterase